MKRDNLMILQLNIKNEIENRRLIKEILPEFLEHGFEQSDEKWKLSREDIVFQLTSFFPLLKTSV